MNHAMGYSRLCIYEAKEKRNVIADWRNAWKNQEAMSVLYRFRAVLDGMLSEERVYKADAGGVCESGA